MAMTVSALSEHHSANNEPGSSPESGSGGFAAGKHHSRNESEESSVKSSIDGDHHMNSSNGGSPVNGHGDSPPKRKRSDSDEDVDYPPRHYDYSPPKRPEYPQHMADRALHVLGNGDHMTNTYYQNADGSEQRERSWSQERQAHSHPHGTNGTSRENGTYESQGHWEIDESSNGQMTQDQYGQHGSSNSSGQGMSKRKRNFSNRTKTGCLTCRKRKKKCDEARPVCNNCSRGGFPCEGYSLTRTGSIWSKPAAVKAPIPLQAKDGYADNNDTMQQRQANRSPDSMRTSLQYESGSLRPPTENHDNGHQYTASPPTNEPRSRPNHPGHSWPPPHGHNNQMPHSGEYLPPLSESRSEISSNAHVPRDMSRLPGQISGPSSNSTHPQQHAPQGPIPPSQAHPHQSHHSLQPIQSHSHQPSPYPPQHPPPPPPPSQSQPSHSPSNAQQGYWPPPTEHRSSFTNTPSAPPSRPDHHAPTPGHMRMSSASFDHHKSGAKTFTVEEVERSRMLRQTRYNHLDPTLINERERCRRALDRYNEACKFENSMSGEDARTMLWKVLDPSRDTTHAFVAPLKEKGTLAHGVVIEAPFTCTYGYNLKIMDDVFVGTGCRIDDAAKVEIGARTSIGPNVTILTSDRVKDMVDRKGSGGSWVASAVTIASEVIIGANAVIYPGVRLERGATVEPNATVKKSLGPNETLGVSDGPLRMT